jgi:hypothetical protein
MQNVRVTQKRLSTGKVPHLIMKVILGHVFIYGIIGQGVIYLWFCTLRLCSSEI